MGDVTGQGMAGMIRNQKVVASHSIRCNAPGLVCLVKDANGYYGNLFIITMKPLEKLHNRVLGKKKEYISFSRSLPQKTNKMCETVIGRVEEPYLKYVYAISQVFDPNISKWTNEVHIRSCHPIPSKRLERLALEKLNKEKERQKAQKDNSLITS